MAIAPGRCHSCSRFGRRLVEAVDINLQRSLCAGTGVNGDFAELLAPGRGLFDAVGMDGCASQARCPSYLRCFDFSQSDGGDVAKFL